MKEFHSGIVEANGVRFTYLEEGEGPLLLCLHGFPDTPHGFRHQLSQLAEGGYRVVAPYMRGYAPTETPSGATFQSAALAKDALALIDALGGGKPAVLMGHDWGAIAAYGAAALAPEKISKLITAAGPTALPWGSPWC